jgi:hypothetical protein
VLVVILEESQEEIDMPHYNMLRNTGDYFGERGFTACHFFFPEELQEEFSIPGIEVLETVGLEGVSTNHRKKFNSLAKNALRYQKWLETHLFTCTHPGIVATSEHMLIICRKKLPD